MGKTLNILRILGTALVTFIFPSLLIALGIPVDRWGADLASWLLSYPNIMTTETSLWILTAFMGVAMATVEAWWKPVGRLVLFLRGKDTSDANQAFINREFEKLATEGIALSRATLEFHTIACLACGKTPAGNINSGPELQMLRLLKDAATDGRLNAANKDSNNKFNMLSTTTSHDLLEFCERHPKPENLLNFARQWTKEVQPRHYVLNAEPGAYQVASKDVEASVSNADGKTEELIPIREAAILAYELTRGSKAALMAERDGNKNPEPILYYYANALVRNSGGIALFGARPPSRQIEEIPSGAIPSYSFSDDLTAVTQSDVLGTRYENLQVREKDVISRASVIKGWG